MKTKIINALKTKYQRFGLSNEAVDRIASALEKTVKSDEEIVSAIADAGTVELIANELQRSADAERRNRSDIQKSFDEYKAKHPDETPKPEPPKREDSDNEVLALLREMQTQNAELKRRLDERDAVALTGELKSKVLAALNETERTNPAVVDGIMRTFSVKSGDTAEGLIEQYKNAYDADYKKYYGDGAVPPVGGMFPPRDNQSKDDFKGAVQRLRDKGVLPNNK